MSGTYSGYEIFTDWTKALALAISNSSDLFQGSIWQKREEQYMDIVRKHGKEAMNGFCKLSGMLIESLEESCWLIKK